MISRLGLIGILFAILLSAFASSSVVQSPPTSRVSEANRAFGNLWSTTLLARQDWRPTVYSQRDFRGRSWRMAGDWRGGGNWDGEVRSVRVPRGVRVAFYSEPNFRGNTHTIAEDWSAAPDDWWTNRVRSIRIYQTGWRPDQDNDFPSSSSDPIAYSERGYRGSTYRLDRDNSNVNFRILSVRVPAGQRVVFYSQTAYRGNEHTLTQSWSAADDDWWDGRVRSIRVFHGNSQPNRPSEMRYPVAYSRRNFVGESATFSRDWRLPSQWTGDPNDVLSIRVPKGWRLVIYSGREFTGESHEITGSWSAAPNDYWAGRIRSIRVYDDDLSDWGSSGSSGGYPRIYAEKEQAGPSIELSRDWAGSSDWDGDPHRVRSLYVPSGWRLVLYSEPNFRGSTYELRNSWTPPSFTTWATKIRSIRVYPPR